jgi:FkbM family methyltransferase
MGRTNCDSAGALTTSVETEAMKTSTILGVPKQSSRGLDELLSESLASVSEREQTFASLVDGSFDGPIVLVGAGRLGVRVGQQLLRSRAQILAFADNDPRLYNTSREGLPVVSLGDAARRFGADALFIVTIWNSDHSYVATERRLRSLGCQSITPWVPVAWAFGDALLPQYAAGLPSTVLAQRDDVLGQADVWADERSAEVYRQQVAWRLSGDFADLGGVDPDQYFPADVVRPREDEVFVDCGAYVGDTLIDFIQWDPAFSGVHAFEPDAAGYASLLATVGRLAPKTRERIQVHQCATGSEHGDRLFAGDGAGGRLVATTPAKDGLQEVETVRLDDVFEGERVTFIKMDIEGAERDALIGATRLLRDQGPLLAISAYHLQDDLWELTKLIGSLAPEHRLYLRPHKYDSFDCVLYAVPPERQV